MLDLPYGAASVIIKTIVAETLRVRRAQAGAFSGVVM
jgi:hypothetical protein